MRAKLLAAIFGVLAVVVTFSPTAAAYNWGPCDVHVTLIEPSGVGAISTSGTGAAAVYFMVDASVGAICAGSGSTQCSAGTFLYYAPVYLATAAKPTKTFGR